MAGILAGQCGNTRLPFKPVPRHRFHCELGRERRKAVTLMPFGAGGIGVPTAHPQGNAMTSVRMLAAGAVALLALPMLAAPVRANCDDRFIKKCETESEAAFVAEQGTTATPPTRRKTPRVRAAFEKPDMQRTRAPRFIARTRPAAPEPAPAVAPDAERPAALAESPLARRFRGFIDPHPLTLNSFEELRKPRLEPEHLVPALAMPAADMTGVAADDEILPPDPPTVVAANVEPTPPRQVAELQRPTSDAAPLPAPAMAEMQAADDDGKGGGFPFHKLVLTLCAALGVASALRFIVRA